MPYKRRYNKPRYKHKRYTKSRTGRYIGYAGSAVSIASKALALSYGIKKLMNVEFKFHDVVQTDTAQNQTASIIQLTNIPQGDTSETRDGAQVKLTRLQIKYTISAGTADVTFVRCIVVHDSQTNQAIYGIADLLQDTTASDSIVSMLNLDNKYRFSILYNKVHSFSNTGNKAVYKEFMKDLDMRIRFDASTPSIADLTSSSLSIVFIANIGSNTPSITLFARVRYVDN